MIKLKNIPNILTISRLLCCPIWLLLFYFDLYIYSLLLIFYSGISDFLDGFLARKFNATSIIGKALDPIADKIIVAAALVLLVMNDTIRNYEVIAAIIILTREILISGLREFLATAKISMPVTSLAKFKTFIQMFSISILLTGESGNQLVNFQDYNAHTIGIILLWLSAFLTLYTGYDYVKKGIDHVID